jgi:phosphatidylinositol-3-phosphatase
MHPPSRLRVIVCAAVILAAAACGSPAPVFGSRPTSGATIGVPAPPGGNASSATAATRQALLPPVSRYTKVLVIPEENKPYGQVIGSADAPYLNQLAHRYGTAAAMDAGYPADCPSLAAYVIMTSGDAHGICDDRNPSAHPLSGGSVFEQLAGAGLQWRMYAESMPTNCSPTNSRDGLYLVRHAPAPYYLSEQSRCRSWDVPLGTPTEGALHADLAAGHLPAYSFVTPNACNDMHGANGCFDRQVSRGDSWLARWLPVILAAPDYQTERLVVIITWDEGSRTDNHIPTLVISPTTTHLTSSTRYTHCSSLRMVEEIVRVPLLRCAATAASMTSGFSLS